jgi:hypothetical protein
MRDINAPNSKPLVRAHLVHDLALCAPLGGR